MVKINKGVIAAAGRGTRFLPTTKGYPKELVPILQKPNIQYLVEELLGAGVDQIAIVHRHGDNKIKRYFTPDPDLEKYLKKNGKEHLLDSLRQIWKKSKVLKFIPQSPKLPYGSSSPILAAKSFIGKDSFIFMYGDDMVVESKPGTYLKSLIEIFGKYQARVVAGASTIPWAEINRYSSVKFKEKGSYPHQIDQVFEKLPRDKAPSNITLFGRFVVNPKIFSVLQKQRLSQGELFFTDTVNALAQTDVVIAQPIKNAQWLTTGDPLRWLKANIIVGLKDKAIKTDLKTFLEKTLGKLKR